MRKIKKRSMEEQEEEEEEEEVDQSHDLLLVPSDREDTDKAEVLFSPKLFTKSVLLILNLSLHE